ncbi:MAG: CbtA family protein [Acidimicrobiia bacterium]
MTTKLLERVDPSRLLPLAVTAALVGIFAGLAGGAFASIAGEPSIDDAIAIEAAAAEDAATVHEGEELGDGHAADGHHHDEDGAVVSRSTQRGVGLFGAYGLTGLAFGALLAVVAFLFRHGGADATRRVVQAGLVLAGAFTVAPWFKYPPNPPAVGDPETLGERQRLYVLLIGVALAVGVGAVQLGRRLLVAGWSGHRRHAAVAALVALAMLAAYAVLPPAPDAVAVPATLVWRFRVASLGANLTLWAVLTLALAWVVAEADRREAGGDGRDAPARVAVPVAGR